MDCTYKNVSHGRLKDHEALWRQWLTWPWLPTAKSLSQYHSPGNIPTGTYPFRFPKHIFTCKAEPKYPTSRFRTILAIPGQTLQISVLISDYRIHADRHVDCGTCAPPLPFLLCVSLPPLSDSFLTNSQHQFSLDMVTIRLQFNSESQIGFISVLLVVPISGVDVSYFSVSISVSAFTWSLLQDVDSGWNFRAHTLFRLTFGSYSWDNSCCGMIKEVGEIGR